MRNIEQDIREEIKRAEIAFPEYNSPHEGYAIIKEELDELWDEIKDKDSSIVEQYKEAKHVACTAIRFMKMCRKISPYPSCIEVIDFRR